MAVIEILCIIVAFNKKSGHWQWEIVLMILLVLMALTMICSGIAWLKKEKAEKAFLTAAIISNRYGTPLDPGSDPKNGITRFTIIIDEKIMFQHCTAYNRIFRDRSKQLKIKQL